MLYIFGGLPGTGKSHLSLGLAKALHAVYVRIDTIEQALRDGGLTVDGPAGYTVGYGVAADNLRLGWDVVADSVNPIHASRRAWREVARDVGLPFVEIEVICSDAEEHRRRVESRVSDIRGLTLPTWDLVVSREYEPWDEADIVVDTASETPQESLEMILRSLGRQS